MHLYLELPLTHRARIHLFMSLRAVRVVDVLFEPVLRENYTKTSEEFRFSLDRMIFGNSKLGIRDAAPFSSMALRQFRWIVPRIVPFTIHRAVGTCSTSSPRRQRLETLRAPATSKSAWLECRRPGVPPLRLAKRLARPLATSA